MRLPVEVSKESAKFSNLAHAAASEFAKTWCWLMAAIAYCGYFGTPKGCSRLS